MSKTGEQFSCMFLSTVGNHAYFFKRVHAQDTIMCTHMAYAVFWNTAFAMRLVGCDHVTVTRALAREAGISMAAADCLENDVRFLEGEAIPRIRRIRHLLSVCRDLSLVSFWFSWRSFSIWFDTMSMAMRDLRKWECRWKSG